MRRVPAPGFIRHIQAAGVHSPALDHFLFLATLVLSEGLPLHSFAQPMRPTKNIERDRDQNVEGLDQTFLIQRVLV